LPGPVDFVLSKLLFNALLMMVMSLLSLAYLLVIGQPAGELAPFLFLSTVWVV
jgi:heme exporter protein B